MPKIKAEYFDDRKAPSDHEDDESKPSKPNKMVKFSDDASTSKKTSVKTKFLRFSNKKKQMLTPKN